MCDKLMFDCETEDLPEVIREVGEAGNIGELLDMGLIIYRYDWYDQDDHDVLLDDPDLARQWCYCSIRLHAIIDRAGWQWSDDPFGIIVHNYAGEDTEDLPDDD